MILQHIKYTCSNIIACKKYFSPLSVAVLQGNDVFGVRVYSPRRGFRLRLIYDYL